MAYSRLRQAMVRHIRLPTAEIGGNGDVTSLGLGAARAHIFAVDQRKPNAIIEKSSFVGANIAPRVQKQENVSYQDCKFVHKHYHQTKSGPANPVGVEGMTWLLPGKFGMFNKQPLHNTAKVYLGRQYYQNYNRDVAVKLVEHREGRDREVRVLMKLHHPNVIQVIDFGEYELLGHWIYIVLELCSQSLYDYTMAHDKKSLNYPQCISFSKQILAGLVYLHRMEIIHRDLKPANILISRCGQYIKVSDFGISKQLLKGQSEATNTSAGMGTEGYMAPELLTAEDKISYGADIFSFGIVMSFIFSRGSHPFGSNPHIRSANIIQNKTPVLNVVIQPEYLTEPLLNLIQQTLRYNPNDRPASKDLLLHEYFSGTNTPRDVKGKVFGGKLEEKLITLNIEDGLAYALQEAVQELFKANGQFYNAVKRVREAIVMPVRNSADEIKLKGDEFQSRNMHVPALILYQISLITLKDQVAKVDDSTATIKDLCSNVYNTMSRMRGIYVEERYRRKAARQYGLEILRDVLEYLRCTSNISANDNALTQARCLNYIALVYSNSGDSVKSIRYNEEGLSVLNRQFGAKSSKHKRYGWLLWNLGDEYYNVGKYSKADSCYIKVITSFRTATYFESDRERLEHIDLVKQCQEDVRLKLLSKRSQHVGDEAPDSALYRL